ncbi:MAG TPA: hypothetical protein VMJ10_30050 [Kofleriaceae bacterium]|nr:hypothetical protein [Kofleriaceae bacterium]
MPRPIATINPLVGDASFMARHGRLPTPADDQTERIATHLAFAEQILRAADVSHLSPSQQAARAGLLAVLRGYIAARRFPLPEARGGRLPAFVDREGTRCAVAALVDHAAGARASERIDARFHDAFAADIDDPALAMLAAEAGLTRAELALIQPTYEQMPPPAPPAIVWQADATAEAAVDSTPGDHPVLGLVGGGLRWEGEHNYYVGDPIVAVDASVGADSSGRVPYAVEARVGTEMLWAAGMALGTCHRCSAHRTGILAGVRLDADGSRVPQAWTIPIDAYWYVPWPGDHVHVGAVGGVAARFAGDDRPLGWNAGVDFVVSLPLRDISRPVMPHGWHARLGIERVADLTFVGLTIGTASAGRYNADDRDW